MTARQTPSFAAIGGSRTGTPEPVAPTMSQPTPGSDPNSRHLHADIDGFALLSELALDLRSSWNHATDLVWRQLDPVLWALTNNPWVVLQTVSREVLQQALVEPLFRKCVHDLAQARRESAREPAWFQRYTNTGGRFTPQGVSSPVPTTRTAAEFSVRVIPTLAGAEIPLESARILWQR